MIEIKRLTFPEFSLLPSQVDLSLIINGRNGLEFRPCANHFPDLCDNQALTVDLINKIKEQIIDSRSGLGCFVLGLQEVQRRRGETIIDGKLVKFIEEDSKVKNYWFGDEKNKVRLLTPVEAAQVNYGNVSVLVWTTKNGILPEMVAQAIDGFYYPATINDVVV